MAKKQFKAESKRLLDLMINSIYTHKEIFLRELISNASDAIDKLYYHSLTEGDTGISRDDFSILIERNEDDRTLKIIDNGMGMTYSDRMVETIVERCREVETGARNIDCILAAAVLPRLARSILDKMSGGEAMPRALPLDVAGDGGFDGVASLAHEL